MGNNANHLDFVSRHAKVRILPPQPASPVSIDYYVKAARNGTISRHFAATPVRSPFSFRRAEWLSLIELWTADKAQSDSWKVVGSMTETETSDVSHLTISAGPGVKFVIRSFQKGTVIFVLSRDDMARFESGLYRVKEFIAP